LVLEKQKLPLPLFLFLCSSLIAQALLVTNSFRGKFGADFVDFLFPYIGVFGLWIFWFIITAVAMVILFDKSNWEMLHVTVSSLKSNKSQDADAIQTLTQTEEKQPVLQEEEIDKPTYLRKKETKEEKAQEKKESSSAKARKTETKTTILDIAADVKEHKNTVIVDELEENTKLLANIEKGKVEKPKNFKLPSVDFLQKPNKITHNVDEKEVDDKIRYLIDKLAQFLKLMVMLFALTQVPVFSLLSLNPQRMYK